MIARFFTVSVVPDLARRLAQQQRSFGATSPDSAVNVNYKTIDEVFDQLRQASCNLHIVYISEGHRCEDQCRILVIQNPNIGSPQVEKFFNPVKSRRFTLQLRLSSFLALPWV